MGVDMAQSLRAGSIPLPVWVVGWMCFKAGFPKKRGGLLSKREDYVEVRYLEYAINHTYFLGEALGALCPDLAIAVLAADPSSWVPVDVSAGRVGLSDEEVARMYAASWNFATDVATQADAEWLLWSWLNNEDSRVPRDDRATFHLLLRRFFAVHVLYGLKNRDGFWSRAERYRRLTNEKSQGAQFGAWEPKGVTEWVEEAVGAFEEKMGPLRSALPEDGVLDEFLRRRKVL